MRRHIPLILAVLIIMPTLTWAAIGIGTPCTGFGAAASSLSINTCTANGSNTLVIAGFRFYTNGQAVTAVTYGGVTMTLLRAEAFTAPDFEARQYVLINPPSGTQTFTVSFDGAVDIDAIVVPFTGVNQSAATGTPNGAHGGATGASIDLASAAGEVVLDFLYAFDTTGLTIGAGQTQQASIGNVRASTEAGAATTTMSWTWTNSDTYLMLGVPIKPAAVVTRRRGGPLWLD